MNSLVPVATDLQMVVDELRDIEKRVTTAEGDSVIARWEFGRKLLEKRKEGKKQLPNGLRAQLTRDFGLEGSEITRRIKLAEKFATVEEVERACLTCNWSWRRVIREVLPDQAKVLSGADDDAAWVIRAEKRVAKLLEESGQSDTRHDALVGILSRALNSVTYLAGSK